jgi:protein TonB
MMMKLDRLWSYGSDATALVLTAAVVGAFLATTTMRLIDARSHAPRDRELRLSLAEEPPAPPPPAPPPPQPHKEPQQHTVQLPAPPVEPTPAIVASDSPQQAATPMPAPASQPAQVADPDLDARYAAELRANIDRRTAPPDSPQYRLHHPSGEVQVLFVVSRSGEQRAVRLLRSSGSALLDEAALRIVSEGRYPPMPARAFVAESQHTFAVTIEFRAAYHAML